jgi:hypothetical protein
LGNRRLSHYPSYAESAHIYTRLPANLAENYVDFYFRTLSSAGSPVFPNVYVSIIFSVCNTS